MIMCKSTASSFAVTINKCNLSKQKVNVHYCWLHIPAVHFYVCAYESYIITYKHETIIFLFCNIFHVYFLNYELKMKSYKFKS